MRALLSWGLVASVCLIPYKGWSQSPPPQPPPPIDKIDVNALQSAIKAALNCGANYLMRMEETNSVGFFYPPTILSNVVSYKDTKIIEEYYRIEKVEVPIYKPIYESYETFAVGGGDSAAGAKAMKKVTKNRVIGQEKIGSTNVERVVLDDKGPLVRKRTIYLDPVYEVNTYWTDGFWGMNGMSLYILIKCGYWDKTNLVADVAKNMAIVLDYSGLPDMTFDVAWLAAAFTIVPDKRYEKLRDRLINKLLDGQVVEGPARGLWGPVCIRGETLAAMIAYEQSLGRALAKAKEKLKAANDQALDRGSGKGKSREKSGVRSREDTVSDAEGMLKDFQRSYLHYAQQGTRFENVTDTFVLEDKTTMLGLPYYIYNQTLADMESTALALFAIREAADNKCLPDTIAKPTGAQSKTLIAQEKTSAVLARAAAAIAALQKKDGTWDESNIHQPLTAFLSLGLPPLETTKTFQLNSPTTMVSVVQAYSAFLDIGGVVGQDKIAGKYKSVLDNGAQAALNSLQTFADKPSMKNNAGRLTPPYDLYAKAAPIRQTPAGSDRRDLLLRLTFFLVNQQRDDGSWRNPVSVGLSSSLVAFWDETQRQAHEKRMGKLPPEKRVPFHNMTYRGHYRSTLRLINGPFLSTAHAMLYLLGEVREPVFGYFSAAGETATPPLVPAALDVLSREKGIPLTSIRVTPQTPMGIVMRVPVIFISSAITPDDKITILLSRYSGGMGFLIIEKPATADADWENKWATIIGASRAGSVPESVSFLQGLPFKPDMRGLYDSVGQLAAVFLPPVIQQTQGGSTSPNPRIAMTAASILRTYIDPAYFTDDYPIKLKGFTGDPFVARVASLELLASALKAQQAQMPDRAVAPAATPSPANAAPAQPAADSAATAEKPAAQDDLLETTEEGIPVPKPKEAAPPKADEVW